MVYLAFEPNAAYEAIGVAANTSWSVWVGSDAITSEEHEQFTQSGVKVTRFTYPLGKATAEWIAGALTTIEEHHPGETIWVQHVNSELEAE